MRTPFGRVSWLSILLLVAIAAMIVTGMLVPGRTGNLIQVGGWIALAVVVIWEVGIRSTPTGDYKGDDRRPY